MRVAEPKMAPPIDGKLDDACWHEAKPETLAGGLFHHLTVWDLEPGNVGHQTKDNGRFDNDTPIADRQRFVFPACAVDHNTVVTVSPGDVKDVIALSRMGRKEIRGTVIGLFDFRADKVVPSFRVDTKPFLASIAFTQDRRVLVRPHTDSLSGTPGKFFFVDAGRLDRHRAS